MWTPVYRRELKASFHLPVFYVLAGIFLFLVSYFTLGMMIEFTDAFRDYSLQQIYGMENPNVTEWVVKGFFSLLNLLFIFMVPLLSMKLYAEEKKSGSLDLLLTCPVKDGEVLAGKFLAALTVLLILPVACFIFPVLFEIFSEPEWPVIWTGYAGIILSLAAYLSIGIFASSITENQVIAAFLSFSGILFFYLAGDVTSAQEGFIGRISSEISLRRHAEPFFQGIIEIGDVFYFIAFCAFFLFLTIESLKIRRWRS